MDGFRENPPVPDPSSSGALAGGAGVAIAAIPAFAMFMNFMNSKDWGYLVSFVLIGLPIFGVAAPWLASLFAKGARDAAAENVVAQRAKAKRDDEARRGQLRQEAEQLGAEVKLSAVSASGKATILQGQIESTSMLCRNLLLPNFQKSCGDPAGSVLLHYN